MKNANPKSIIGLAVGIAIGSIIYDYFFHEGIDWGKAFFQFIFIAIILFVLKQVSSPQSS